MKKKREDKKKNREKKEKRRKDCASLNYDEKIKGKTIFLLTLHNNGHKREEPLRRKEGSFGGVSSSRVRRLLQNTSALVEERTMGQN